MTTSEPEKSADETSKKAVPVRDINKTHGYPPPRKKPEGPTILDIIGDKECCD